MNQSDVLLEDENNGTIQEEQIEEEKTIQKSKKQLTEKQKQALKNGLEKRQANIKIANEIKKQEAEKKQKEKEELIVKKAVAIKKKELKERAILNHIKDDDTPIEDIKKKLFPAPEPSKPPSIFNKYKFV